MSHRKKSDLPSSPRDLRPELVEPVEHHIDPRPDPLGRTLEHQEPLSIGRNIVAHRTELEPTALMCLGCFEEKMRLVRRKDRAD